MMEKCVGSSAGSVPASRSKPEDACIVRCASNKGVLPSTGASESPARTGAVKVIAKARSPQIVVITDASASWISDAVTVRTKLGRQFLAPNSTVIVQSICSAGNGCSIKTPSGGSPRNEVILKDRGSLTPSKHNGPASSEEGHSLNDGAGSSLGDGRMSSLEESASSLKVGSASSLEDEPASSLKDGPASLSLRDGPISSLKDGPLSSTKDGSGLGTSPTDGPSEDGPSFSLKGGPLEDGVSFLEAVSSREDISVEGESASPQEGEHHEDDNVPGVSSQEESADVVKTPGAVPGEIDFAARRSMLRFKCGNCGRECPSKHKLKRHLSTHSEARPFPCKLCGRSFKWTEYLQKHMRQQHPSGRRDPEVQGAHCSIVGKNCLKPARSRFKRVSASRKPRFKSHETIPEVKDDDHMTKDGCEQIPSTTEEDKNEEEPPSTHSVSVGVDMDAEEEAAAMAASQDDMICQDDITAYQDMAACQDMIACQDMSTCQDMIASQADMTACQDMIASQDNMSTCQDMITSQADVTASQDMIACQDMAVCQDMSSQEMTSSHDMTAFQGMAASHDMAISQEMAVMENSMETVVYGDGRYVNHLGVEGTDLRDAVYGYGIPTSVAQFCCSSMGTNTFQGFPQQSHGTTMDPSSVYLQTLSMGSKSTCEALSQCDTAMENALCMAAIDSSHMVNQCPANSGLAEHQYPSDSGIGEHQYPSDSGIAEHQYPADSEIAEHQYPPAESGLAEHQYPPADSGLAEHQYPPAESGIAEHQYPPADSGLAEHQYPPADSGLAEHQYPPADSGLAEHQYPPAESGLAEHQYPPAESGLEHQYPPAESGLADHLCVHCGNDPVSVSPVDLINTAELPQGSSANVHLNLPEPSQYYSDGEVQVCFSDMQQQQQQMSNFACMANAAVDTSSISSYINPPPQPVLGYHQSMDGEYEALPHTNSVMLQAGYDASTSHIEMANSSDYTSHQYHEQYQVGSLPDNLEAISFSHPQQQQGHECASPCSDSTVKVDVVRVDSGIQCDLGPETLQALFDDEDMESVKEGSGESQPSKRSRTNSGSDGSSPDDRLVQKYPCRVEGCDKAYIYRKDVIRHMRTQHGVTPQKLEAITVEAPEKPHVCGVASCRRSYFHMKDLRRHRRLCHQVNLKTVNLADEETDQNPTPLDNTQMRYPCDFGGCLRSYVHKKDLVRHKRLFHNDSSSKPSIPVPIKFTDVELKQIRHKVKQEIDTKEKKMRLDSTGSAISVSNSTDEDATDFRQLDLTLENADCTILLSSSSSLEEVRAMAELDDPAISSEVASILEQHGSQLFGHNQ